MIKLGIMQGRFTDKGGFYPQQFPWNNWQKEFETAKEAKIEYIEWMFNYDNFFQNPLWHKDGKEEIIRCQSETGISVISVCANYFMVNGLFKEDFLDNDSYSILETLMKNIREIGAKILVLPIFEKNLPTHLDPQKIVKQLKNIEILAENQKVRIALESDWDANLYNQLLSELNSDYIGICYDLGNASGNRKNILKELTLLEGKIIEVHIKDKPINGNTVMLGQGDVDFKACINQFRQMAFTGPFILESYYGEHAVLDTLHNINYVRRLYKGA